MERTPLPPAAEALFRAHHDRSTGWLTLVCGGREAKLYLQHGDLVGARLVVPRLGGGPHAARSSPQGRLQPQLESLRDRVARGFQG